MATFIDLLALAHTQQDSVYIATIIADLDDDGTHETVSYGVIPNDFEGIAGQVHDAIREWKLRGNPIAPFVPPTVEELRSWLPTLTRRQLRRVLLLVGIDEAAIELHLSDDPDGLIEWEDATYYRRLHPLVIHLAQTLNLPPEQVDSLWAYGLSL